MELLKTFLLKTIGIWITKIDSNTIERALNLNVLEGVCVWINLTNFIPIWSLSLSLYSN